MSRVTGSSTLLRISALTCALAASAVAQITPESGNVGAGGGPFNVFFVNGTAGGADRTVEIGLNKPVTLQVLPNGTVGAGAPFAIFGFFGTPGPGDVSTLPFGIGQSAFPFCPLQPTNPVLFALTDQFGLGCPELISSTPTPWTFPLPFGFPFAFVTGLQGIILDPAGVLGISVTNMVVTNFVDDRLEVLYSRIAGHSTAIIPGAVDPAGNPVVTEFRAFEQLVGSPDGAAWMMRARTQQGAGSETIMLVGGGTSGTAFAQEGRPVHGGAPGEIYDFFGSGLGRFNNNNDFAYSARASGGPTGTLQKVIRVVGGVGTIVMQEGGLYTGLSDIMANPSGDEKIGNSIGSVHLLDNLSVGTQDSTITQISTTRRPAITYDAAAFHQTNVTSVLEGVTPRTWATIDANKFYTTPDGVRWIAPGRINGVPTANDAVLVVDGAVALQEGVAIPGSSTLPSSFLNVGLSGNGHWYARGAQTPSGVYAAADGVLVAKTGDPIVTGSTENWASSYSAFAGNRLGEWVLFGQTDSANPAADHVIVFNGTTVIAREGDPVDLNRNGLFDDDVFLGRGNNTLTPFSADNAFLTDDGFLYFFINLRNSAGVDLANLPAFGSPLALLRVRIPRG